MIQRKILVEALVENLGIWNDEEFEKVRASVENREGSAYDYCYVGKGDTEQSAAEAAYAAFCIDGWEFQPAVFLPPVGHPTETIPHVPSAAVHYYSALFARSVPQYMLKFWARRDAANGREGAALRGPHDAAEDKDRPPTGGASECHSGPEHPGHGAPPVSAEEDGR